MSTNTMNMGPSGPMGNPIDDTMERTADRAEQAVGDTASRAHQAVNRMAPNVDRMADRAHQTIDNTAQWAQDTARRLADSTSQYTDQWSEYVRQRPLASVGVALAVGYAFGRLMR